MMEAEIKTIICEAFQPSPKTRYNY